MANEIIVGIGEIVVSSNPIILGAIGIGSCVAVAIYDTKKNISGLAHIMLPDSRNYCGKTSNERNLDSFTRYADIAIPKMIEDMEKLGANKKDMHAKIAGGAHMFSDIKSDTMNIGMKNAEAAKKALSENNILIDSEDLGGNNGRSVRFEISTQKMNVKTIKEIKEI